MRVHAGVARRDKAVVGQEIDARRPEADEGLARPNDAGADAAAHIVAGAGDHRRLGRQAPAIGVLAAQRADHLGASGEARQTVAVDADGLEDGPAPSARHGVHQQRRAPVSFVGDDLAGQAQPHEILGQQNGSGPREQLRLVLRKPAQLRGREARHRACAGKPGEIRN